MNDFFVHFFPASLISIITMAKITKKGEKGADEKRV